MGNGTYERGTASLFRLAANKDLLMFGCHHDTVWLRRGPQSSQPGQSVPPTDSLGCHLSPLCRTSSTSFPLENQKKECKSTNKFQGTMEKNSYDCCSFQNTSPSLSGKVLLHSKGKSYPFSHPPAHWKKQSQPIHRHCRLPREPPGGEDKDSRPVRLEVSF